jgi:hypothetical protein
MCQHPCGRASSDTALTRIGSEHRSEAITARLRAILVQSARDAPARAQYQQANEGAPGVAPTEQDAP